MVSTNSKKVVGSVLAQDTRLSGIVSSTSVTLTAAAIENGWILLFTIIIGSFPPQGEFRCNTPMGRGTYTWPNGSTYVGQVHHGLRHGTGTLVCAANGVSYTGQWNRGKRHGKVRFTHLHRVSPLLRDLSFTLFSLHQGMLHYNQEKTSWYDGEWVQNRKEGWGVRWYAPI